MISEDRQLYFAKLIVNGLWDDDLVDFTDDDQALRQVRQTVMKFFKEEDVVDELVRKKLITLKRGVPEGSREWETLYLKYYEEESKRRG